jgi:hypothetical protein
MATGSDLLLWDSIDPCTRNIRTADLRYPEGSDIPQDRRPLDVANWLRTQYACFSTPLDDAVAGSRIRNRGNTALFDVKDLRNDGD